MQPKIREGRRRPRASAPREHVGWTGADGRFRRAEVADQSEDGIGLVIQTDQPPLRQGVVRILSRGEDHNRSARVMWTAPADMGRHRMGCSWRKAGPEKR